MVTPEELRERPVLLELSLLYSSDKISWFSNDEKDYSLLEKMNAKECVEYMLNTPELHKTRQEKEFKNYIKGFIKDVGKGYYSIDLKDEFPLICGISMTSKGTVKVFDDERIKPIKDVLIDAEKDMQKIWYQKLIIEQFRFVD